MSHLNLFDESRASSTKVMIVNFGEKESVFALGILELLHKNGISSELYPDASKLKKQISYADSKKIPYVIMAGENEINNNTVTVKIMSTGEQKNMKPEELNTFFN
jgi:histidyl-tRNA synthetase